MPDDRWFAWPPRIEFELRDCWVGLYWDRKIEDEVEMVDLYICLVPTLPLHLHFEREEL